MFCSIVYNNCHAFVIIVSFTTLTLFCQTLYLSPMAMSHDYSNVTSSVLLYLLRINCIMNKPGPVASLQRTLNPGFCTSDAE
jgi:hypothetical protein